MSATRTRNGSRNGGNSDDTPFMLHLAFAAERGTAGGTAGASPGQRSKCLPVLPPFAPASSAPAPAAAAAAASSTAATPVKGLAPHTPDVSTSPVGDEAASPSPSPSPAHDPPFGFLSIPINPSVSGAGAGATAGALASVRAGQVTLAHVRALLPTHFPPQHVAQLVSAGVLSSASARALLSGSYFFLAAGGGAPPSQNDSGSSSSPADVSLSISVPFLPVSPVQEDSVLARHCRPVLVLKAMGKSMGPHPTPKSHMTHGANDASGAHTMSAASAGYLQDYLPGAPAIGGRRGSFDLSSAFNAAAQQDSLTSLGLSSASPAHNHFLSPPTMTRAHTTGMVRSSHIGDEDRRHGGGHGGAAGSSGVLGSTAKLTPYDSALADGILPVHFDDVIREKSTAHLLRTGPTGSPIIDEDSGAGDASALRITVTGELLDLNRNNAGVRMPRTPTRRHANSTAYGPPDVDDERDGSVKVFRNIDDFLRDEERRRAKYDEQAAAHMAAQAAVGETDEGATPVESPRSSLSASASSSSMSGGRDPLPQTPLWISIEDGDDAVVEHIGRYFGLHPLTVEDCQSRGIREKLEVFPEYLFLVFHAIDDAAYEGSAPGSRSNSMRRTQNHLQAQESEVMRTTPLKLVIFPSLVLSFHKGGLPAVNVVRKQLAKLYRNRVLNTAWLIHGLLDVVSDSLMPVVDAVCALADQMEDMIYLINPGRESHKDVLRRMGAIARRLTFLRQRLWSKRDILTSLIEKDWQFFLNIKVPYLRDIYDHLVIMLHKLDAAIEVIVTLQSTYLAVVSIDVAAVSNEGNTAMKTLSASATILLPLSLIASLMGMNVLVPFQFDAESISFRDLLPFSLICLSMLAISSSLYSYFKKQKYL